MSFWACSWRKRGKVLLACVVVLFALRQAKAQSTDAAEARANALTLEQRGENAEAEQAWQTIAQADPRDAEAFAHLGLLEARQERLGSALDFYRKAIALNPDLPGLQMNFGLALFKGAQFPDAIRVFSAELKRHSNDQRLTILLGMAHYGMKDYFVAIPYLRRAADHDLRSLALRMTLARSCLLSKQYQCVMDAQREIKALDPKAAEVDILAAEALDERRDGEGALAQLKAAAEANPEQANVHFALGYLLWTKGQWAEAAGEFQSELQRNPLDLQSRVYLADSQVQQGDFVTPVSELEKLAQSAPSEPLVHLDLGMLAAKTGHTEDAVREFRTASQYGPENADLVLRIAKQLELLGRTEDARLERERVTRAAQTGHLSLLDVLESSN